MSEIERPSPNSARTVLVYDRRPEELLDAVERAVQSLPNWSLADQGEDFTSGINAIRSTSLLRFKDEVKVETRTGDEPGQSRLVIASRSRLGRSDFGQNPRNLRELISSLERELKESG